MKYKNIEECINAIDDKAIAMDSHFAAALSLINAAFRIKTLIVFWFIYVPLGIGIISNFYGYRKQFAIASGIMLIISFFGWIFEDIIRKNFHEEWKKAKRFMAEKEFTKYSGYYNCNDHQKNSIFETQILPIIGVSSDIKKNNEVNSK